MDLNFKPGDLVRVTTKVKEGDKFRQSNFDGTVLAIRGSQENKTFTVRKIGDQKIAIERIWPLNSPWILEVKVLKKGQKIRRAKLTYLRNATN
ncbi:MAG TPA: 50S ribosomal protein L19 [Patescibacteria group bacterium]